MLSNLDKVKNDNSFAPSKNRKSNRKKKNLSRFPVYFSATIINLPSL